MATNLTERQAAVSQTPENSRALLHAARSMRKVIASIRTEKHNILNYMPQGILVIRSDGLIIGANDAAANLLGVIPATSLYGQQADKIFTFQNSGQSSGNGLIEPLSDKAKTAKIPCHRYEQNKHLVYFLEANKQTLHSTAEEKSENYSIVMNALNQGISYISKDLILEVANKRFYEVLDLPADQFGIGSKFADIIRFNAERGEYGEGDIDAMVEERVEKAKLFIPHKFQRIRPDGTVIEIRGWPLPQGGFVTTYTDVTELNEMTRNLEAERLQLSAVVNSVREAIITINNEGNILTFNRRAEIIFGYSVSQAPDLNIVNLFDTDGKEQKDFIDNVLLSIEDLVLSKKREFTGIKANGERFPVEINISILELPGGITFCLFCEDLTKKKEEKKRKARMEMELRQAQKMEALGTLAGGIAHEINTPTQYTGDNIQFLKESFGDLTKAINLFINLHETAKQQNLLPELTAEIDKASNEIDLDYLLEEIPLSIDQSLEGVSRITEIVQATKAFSYRGTQEKSFSDIHSAIMSSIIVSRNQWKYVAHVDTDLDDTMPKVPVILSEFNQVLLNLIVNAAHAIEDKHKKSGTDPDHEKESITIKTEQRDGYAVIAISDTGCGIPEKNIATIFEPFFTTKEPGRGTGQGLAISHTIITQKHNGQIEVESEVGKGTTFKIYLPLEAKNNKDNAEDKAILQDTPNQDGHVFSEKTEDLIEDDQEVDIDDDTINTANELLTKNM